MKRKKYILFAALSALPLSLFASNEAAPFTFWYWMYGAVSKPGIHADLVGMKNAGLQGCYLMPIRSSKDKPEFKGTSDQLSPEFWNNVDYAFQQADSLKLDMGIHICDGFALAGGPWITAQESMQKVAWKDTIVTMADLRKGVYFRDPECVDNYFESIGCWAMPLRKGQTSVYPLSKATTLTLSPSMTRNDKGVFRASEPGTIDFDLGKMATIHSLQIVPSGNNIQSQRVKVLASNDGVNFWLVKQLEPARQGWQSYGHDFTYSIPATTARYFRFAWTPEGTEPGSEDLDPAKWKPVLKLKDIVLSEAPLIHQWEGKSGASWRIAEATPAEEVTADDCVKLSDLVSMQMSGRGVWRPVGKNLKGVSSDKKSKDKLYRVLWFYHTSTGQMNATAGGGKGLEIDKFNVDAVDKLFDNWYKKFLDRPHSSVVKYLHIDSWECGQQNWGYNFAEEFKQRRGYDLLPYMPLYAGVPMESVEKSEQVLRDIRLTVNDLVNDVFFHRLEDRGHNYWKKISHESIAPTFVADGLEHYKYSDIPMGEFWLNSPTHDKPNDMLDAISGAHIYGKNIVQAEGFTEVRGVWNETPAMVKPLLDRHFALGMNRLFFHVDAHNPWMDRKPGMTLDGIGLFYQRDNTWYSESKGFVDYITRCQKLLQMGHPVVDIAVFTGEEMPSRSLTPDRIVEMLPGIFGKERVESEQKRLANAGLPMEESPVGINHSAGILDMKDWTNCLNGYKYDCINKDALIEGSKVENGRLIMPGGISYRILVLPGKTKMDPSFKGYSPEVEQRIAELREAGVVIIDQPYTASDFSQYGLPRDVELPKGMDYAHRSCEDKQVYFLTNQTNEARDIRWKNRDSKNELVAHFEPYQSKFFICDNITTDTVQRSRYYDPVKDVSDVNIFSGTSGQGIKAEEPLKTSSWNLEFVENQLQLKSDTLLDWTKLSDDKMKYYSGRVVYTTQFVIKKKIGKTTWEGFEDAVLLNLGDVRDIAHVYVNDVDCGIAWTASYEVNITKALKKGKNTLRIEVVNTWANALKGTDKGKAPYEGIWTNAKYRMKGDELLPAGLLGSLNLKVVPGKGM